MKTLLTLVTAFVLTTTTHAGIVGLFTAKTRNWTFIEETGGIHLGAPVAKEGKRMLPVEYWPEGNSGLAVHKISLDRQDSQLVIRVVTQVVEKGSDTSRVHYVDLSEVPAGSYKVYYETAGDPGKLLGRIDID